MLHAAYANNDTVNITMYVNTPPNVTFVELDDYAPSIPADQIDLVAAANKTVYCILNITDPDGYEDINQSTMNVSIYLLSRGYNATENPKFQNNLLWSNTINSHACLNTSLGGSNNNSDGWRDYNCSIQMPYYSENGTWVCVAKISDTFRLKGEKNDTCDVNQLIALNISVDKIDFGALALGGNTTASNYNTSIENIGNVPLSVDITSAWNNSQPTNDTYGMKCTQGYINETDIKFDDEDQTFHSEIGDLAYWTPLAPGFTSASDMSLVEATSSTKVYYDIFWGIHLSASQPLNPKGYCKGWLFFDAVIG
jgi:hypothetical protein